MTVAGFQVSLQPNDISKVGSIFLVENPHPVHWGHISLLNADIACMEQLIKRFIMESVKKTVFMGLFSKRHIFAIMIDNTQLPLFRPGWKTLVNLAGSESLRFPNNEVIFKKKYLFSLLLITFKCC